MKISELWLRDPFIARYSDGYCVYGTYGPESWNCEACSGLYCYSGTDLNSLTEKRCFVPPDGFWGRSDFWAPEAHCSGKTWYIFATFYGGGQRRCHVLSSERPDSGFVPLARPLTPEGWMCLDATLYEEDGKRYAFFCREWTEVGDGQICLVELDEEMNAVSVPRVLFRGSEAPWTRRIRAGCTVTDGPFVRRLRDGRLVMLWSSMGQSGYATGQAFADRPDGSWTHADRPLIDADGGHAMLFSDDNGLNITFHSPNAPSGAERVVIRRVEETPSGLRLL